MSKKLNKGFIKIISLASVLWILMCINVFAATTLMTYNGTGIRDKASISSFKLSKKTTVAVNHTTSKWSGSSEINSSKWLNVAVQKKGAISYSTVGSTDYYSTGSWTTKYTLDSGTYRLYFTSHTSQAVDDNYYSANIDGSVTK